MNNLILIVAMFLGTSALVIYRQEKLANKMGFACMADLIESKLKAASSIGGVVGFMVKNLTIAKIGAAIIRGAVTMLYAATDVAVSVFLLRLIMG